jgi:integrase/recombinase XerC
LKKKILWEKKLFDYGVIARFLEYIAVEKKYSPRTVEAYQEDLKSFCGFMNVEMDALDVSKIHEHEVKMWLVALMDEEKQSPRSVKRKLSCLKSFYRFLLKVGVVDKDITRMIISPKIDKPLPVFFKQHEMQRATAYDDAADDFESIRDTLIINVLYQTGMRQAELLGLQDVDVDIHQRQIRVFGKRRKERIIPIGDSLVEQIKKYLNVRNEFQDVGAFFVRVCDKKGVVPMTKGVLYRIVCARMGEVSTLKKHSPHVLRHTFATTMLDNGADIRTIQSLMGHASLAATQVYTHTTFEQIKKIYKTAHPRATKRKE